MTGRFFDSHAGIYNDHHPLVKVSRCFQTVASKMISPADYSVPLQELPTTVTPCLGCSGVFKTQPRKTLKPADFSISVTPCLRCGSVFKTQYHKTLTPADFSISATPCLRGRGIFKMPSHKTIMQTRSHFAPTHQPQ